MGKPHSEEAKQRISHGMRRAARRRKQAMRIGPRDPRTARLAGQVVEGLRGAVYQGELELSDLLETFGGMDALTPTTRAVIEDAVSVGVALRGELGRYLQTGDPDAASRLATLANTRRNSFALLGLDPQKAEPRSIASIAAEFSTEAATEDRGRSGAESQDSPVDQERSM